VSKLKSRREVEKTKTLYFLRANSFSQADVYVWPLWRYAVLEVHARKEE